MTGERERLVLVHACGDEDAEGPKEGVGEGEGGGVAYDLGKREGKLSAGSEGMSVAGNLPRGRRWGSCP